MFWQKIKLKESKSIKGKLQAAGTVLTVGYDPSNLLVIGERCAEWLIERGAAELIEKKEKDPQK